MATAEQERDQQRQAAAVAAARLEEQAIRLADVQRQVEAQASELAQARTALVELARLEGEIAALRGQQPSPAPPRRVRKA